MTIASCHIFFINAEPGTGKTFTGDYLEKYHGFTHVDGDTPIRNLHIAKNREMQAGWEEYKMKKKIGTSSGQDKLWQPYMQELVDMTLDAAKTSDKVVLTKNVQYQNQRDFVITKLKEGGAADNNITLVFLTMDEDVKLEGLYHRTKQQVEANGMTMEDAMKAYGVWDGEGVFSVDKFKAGTSALCPDIDGPPSYAKVLDVTVRDETSLESVDKVFGLDRDWNVSYDEIVKELTAVDVKRDNDTPYDLKEMGKIDKEVKMKSKEEQELIQKRRSSLLKVERKLGLTRLSVSSTGSSSSTDENNNEKLKGRRHSLIMTGKID